MKKLADAAKREEVDGEMALEMIRPDWQQLGASGLKASESQAKAKHGGRLDGRRAMKPTGSDTIVAPFFYIL